MLTLQKNNAGFTLLESLLALGILSVVTVQIVNVQSSSIAVTATTKNAMRATWAMKAAVAQLEYVIDTQGVEGLPKATSFGWSADEAFKISIVTKQTNIEASKLLITAMKLGGASADDKGDQDKEDPSKGFKEIGDLLDSQIPKDMYRTVQIQVAWKDGETEKSMEGGMLVIDDKAIKVTIPGLDSLPDGGTGAGGVGTGGTGTGTAPTGTAPTGTAPTGTAPTGTAPTGTAPTGTAPTGGVFP